MKFLCTVLGLALAGTFAMAAAPRAPQDLTVRELVVSRIVLKDKEYSTIVQPGSILLDSPDGSARFETSHLTLERGLFDSGGARLAKRSASLDLDEGGSSLLLNARTDDLKQFMTATLEVANGHPSLTMAGLRGLRLLTDEAETPPRK